MTEIKYYTKEGLEKLKTELEQLVHVERPNISQQIAEARDKGDLSENAEYHQTREDQGKLEERIKRIEQILQSSEVVKGGGGDIIEIGSRVVVQKEGTEDKKTYQIVGDDEADIKGGKISVSSPIARALIGKSAGDVAEVTAPGGIREYEVIEVLYV